MLKITILASFFCLAPMEAAAWMDQKVVSLAEDGRIEYDLDEHGNRVPDFSHAGYGGGGVPIPQAPVKVVVEPRPGDGTARIQRAIDHVSQLPTDAYGIRGAILLTAGRHEVSGALQITRSGVVLRGEGMGEYGTTLIATGKDRRTLIRVAGENNLKTETNLHWRITDDYVPVGATEFALSNAAELKIGDRIRVIRPCSMEWIDALGAREFGGGEGDWRLTWKPGSREIVWDRTILSIEGDQITIDAPITTAIENRFGGGTIERYEWPGRIEQVGIENIRLDSGFDPNNPLDEDHAWFAITLENVENVWVRQVTARHFAGSMVAAYENTRKLTVQDCISLDPVSEMGGYRRHTFFTMGQQTLFLRCYAENGRHDFSVGHASAGPNAFVQCESVGALADSGSIESWASGVLYDNVQIDGHGLTLGYRGPAPHGAGWAAANSVSWQCSAAYIQCENPPTAQNWAFGSWAEFIGNGHWRSSNEFVSPDSLYAAQLKDRLGKVAENQLQLMPRPRSESSNPTIERAQELAKIAREPKPMLLDYIKDASNRDPISVQTNGAIHVDEIPLPSFSGIDPSLAKPLVLTNGWLTIGNQLLIGEKTGVAWWKGNTRPGDATSVGLGLTRFVPGRIGAGWTDDLLKLADALAEDGTTVLEHHYGLWYDRRRDDHQRVRRMDGDVWPPFYEQPFLRSGIGKSWDGLSQYDLTRFNTWYWDRLRNFAGICDRKGLVLLHQNYFQHNILEAGAHWVDSPWRSANNINDTGFPEPLHFAGDKRIFMADLFYDTNHPARRELHRGYIRQCLENFKTNSNVLQSISAEFTGPLHFMEFWLDTLAEWKSEQASIPSARPLTVLSSTKDVQDTILADPIRRSLVDVIDLRYWWRTSKGEFAPPGGKNLAPRQFERQWRGGKPTDIDLAEMASLYRKRFPEKALICNFENASWAWLCAGGSQPRLPPTTDTRLLEAIPGMRPVSGGSQKGVSILKEHGKGYLMFRTEGDTTTVDLTDEAHSFRLFEVHPETGSVKSLRVIKGGEITEIKSRLIWLVKAESLKN